MKSSYSHVKSHIFSPDPLIQIYKQQKMDVTVANYGYIPYGQSLIGNLYYANPRNACLPLDFHNMNFTDPSPIILVERGGCHFVTKSHYAQLFGAKMVIVVDNEFERENSVMMIDDGYGFDIHIPTIMISKNDGDYIGRFINSNNVAISFEFVLDNKPENFVTVEYWMSSYDEKSYDFLFQFQSFREKLSNDLFSFIPHYALWYCSNCREQNFTTPIDNCLSNGRYCIPDAESQNLKNIKGSDVVYEDLTQICLYTLDHEKWWSYIDQFYKKCLKTKKEHKDLKTCSEEIYSNLKFSKKKVEMCINDSFIDKTSSNRQDGENILLNQEQKTFMTEGIQLWPTMRINNETYRGKLAPIRGAINAICGAYHTEIQACTDEKDKNLSKTSKMDTGTGVSTFTFIAVSVLCIVLFALILLFIYQRKIRKEMASDLQNQVNTHLSKYFSLSGEKK